MKIELLRTDQTRTNLETAIPPRTAVGTTYGTATAAISQYRLGVMPSALPLTKIEVADVSKPGHTNTDSSGRVVYKIIDQPSAATQGPFEEPKINAPHADSPGSDLPQSEPEQIAVDPSDGNGANPVQQDLICPSRTNGGEEPA